MHMEQSVWKTFLLFIWNFANVQFGKSKSVKHDKIPY